MIWLVFSLANIIMVILLLQPLRFMTFLADKDIFAQLYFIESILTAWVTSDPTNDLIKEKTAN